MAQQTNHLTKKTDDVVLVSELKCTVAEFATKYTTLKKGEKVNVTLTDVSDANISKLAQTLQKMSATTISKAASDDNYIVVLVLESKDELTKIPAEVFKDCKAIVSVTIPECVELIESGAFDGCSALPQSVTMIGDWAFSHCDNLQTIYCSQAVYDEYHETYPQMVVK